MKNLRRLSYAFALLALAPLHAPLVAQSTAVAAPTEAPVWAFETSDIPLDPQFRFGQLDNGMRYVVRPNATPVGTGVVQMHVAIGSASERETERGYAHFVEHMAFNGSTHVPEGEMVKLLEREGLAFGADTNASTSFDATIYKLDLPRNSEALLDTALMLMRETAGELSFLPEAVEREKGVVLSEKRVRDTYALRNFVDQLDFLYPGSTISQRLPIGTEDSLTGATAAGLKAFWQRNYVPENITLIVVGDFAPEQVEAMIREHFADWQGPDAPASAGLGPVDPTLSNRVDFFTEPALPEQVTVSRNGGWVEEPDTIANERDSLIRDIAVRIINRRFARIARSDDAPFRNAGFGQSELRDAGRTTNLVINVGDGEWRAGMLAAVTEYRRALAFGFTQAELDEQLAAIRTSLENSAAGADTLPNNAFVGMALSLVTEGNIPSTPADTLSRFKAIEGTITPEAVLNALRNDFVTLDDPLIRFEGKQVPDGGSDALWAAWEEARAAPILAPADAATAEFGYSDFGTPGEVVNDTVEPLLSIRTIRFANGVRLNLKRTELQKDRISLRLNVDGGQMLNTRDNPAATNMASSLNVGGLGKHSLDELQTILAGRSVGLSTGADDESFVFAGSTTPRDLQLQLQLMAAAISDSGFRPDGELQYRRNIASFFASKDATPANAFRNAIGAIVSDDDPRYSIQPQAVYEAQTFAQLRETMADRLANGALELAIVGDFEEEQAIAMVAATLGALPAREAEFRAYDENRQRSFTPDRSRRVVYHQGQPNQAMIRFSWPTRDGSDEVESTQLNLLAQIVQLEMTDKLREELGQSYSPGAGSTQSLVWPGWGTFEMGAEVDPAQIDAARAAMLAVVEDIRSAPPSADLVQRARQPVLERLDNRLKTNGGWIGLVEKAQSKPDLLARFTSARARVMGVSAEQIQAMALRYLDPAQMLEVDVLPKPAE